MGHKPTRSRVSFWYINKPQVPYMNSELRKAMHQRNMWRNKYFKKKGDRHLRQMYVKWRNKVTKLRKISIQRYFDQRCSSRCSSKDFYKTVKPFLSDNNFCSGNKIILSEDKNIISDPLQVANIFNLYYSSVSEYKDDNDGLDILNLGEVIAKHASHKSIELIKRHVTASDTFFFKAVSPECFQKYINQLQSNKAVGHDGIRATFLKLAGPHFAKNLCDLFNTCVISSCFPSQMKLADITPLFKKDDTLCKENYRSVNLLIAVSKVFERILCDQLNEFFEKVLSSSLSAYRKGHNCQHVILRLTEHWRQALDNGHISGTVAMDLSKAFDRMPHGLLISKLHAYGLSDDACNMVISYLKDRRQRVKVMGEFSYCTTINRGVPQGSVMGPLLFNIFLNDLFYVDMNCDIANYADDNHIYYANSCAITLKNVLENDTRAAITWFENNYMDANPDKFQSIILNRGGDVSISLTVQDNVVIPSDHIRVLGITLDDSLKFDLHISDMCKKASRQINALKRISKFLTQDSRKSIYRSFIAANFNYCPISWMFCGKKNTSKLEKLQERALRLVFCDQISSYDDLLKRGNFLSLKAYRIKCLAVEVFKCVHGFNPTYLNRLFTEPLAIYNLRDRRRLNQPRFHTYTYGFRSFRYSGSKLWNSLPRAIKNTNDINEFKKNITEWCQTRDLTKLEIF